MAMDEAKKEALKMEALGITNYNRVYLCDVCGGLMVFKGCGEYECEDCHTKGLDDYGKVRNYIEQHAGANSAEIESETGVSQKSIRQMLKESKLEITSDSVAFMKCEFCGENIRSGRFCQKCEVTYHREKERQMKEKMKGFGLENEEERRERQNRQKGERRFLREE